MSEHSRNQAIGKVWQTLFVYNHHVHYASRGDQRLLGQAARAALSWKKPHLTPSPEAALLWEKCKELLRGRVTRPIYATWISPTKGFAVDGDVIWVRAETSATAEWLDHWMARLCEEALQDAGKPNAELKFFVEPTVDSPHIENSDTDSSGADAML